MISLIDKLQENESYHYIDYIPYNPENPNYLDLEEYFQKYIYWILRKKSSV